MGVETLKEMSLSQPEEDGDDAVVAISPSRIRAKHTRSKLGCGVCRVRRIRCDQARPACLRCSSTGRACDGYPSPLTRSAARSRGDAVSKPPARIHSKSRGPWAILYEPAGLGEFEGRMFQFFATRTASELDGDFEDDFWRKVVLQVSQRVPFVRHAVLALTCLHTIHCMKQPTFPTVLPADPIDLRQQATYHYSRAIQLLNHHISTNRWASLEQTLLCCVLCIRFEWVAGNRTAALVHLRSSLQILREWQALPPSTSPAPTSFWSPGGYLIRFTISPLYVRIALEASMFADVEEAVPVPLRPPSPLGSQPFASLSEARDSLYEILGDEYLFRHQGTAQRKRPDRHGKLSAIERFNHWSLSAAALLLKFDVQDRESTPPVIVLRIWLKIVRIMLEAKDKNDECIFDQYSDDFSAAVDLASKMYSLKTSSFTADTSIVAVLYYVAAKCRHPTTRRRAIALLEKCPRQEGIWHSATAVRLATYIVEQEEEAAGRPVHTEADVPRTARMYGWELRGQSQGVFNFQAQSEETESTCASKKDLSPGRIPISSRVEQNR